MKRKTLLVGMIGILLLAGIFCWTRCVFDFPGTVVGIRRADVVECGLPDGSKFILRNEYLWDPIAELIPADVTTRYDLDGSFYRVSYVRPWRFGIEEKMPSLTATHGSCTSFGMKDKVLLGPAQYLAPRNHTWQSPLLPAGIWNHKIHS